MSTLTPSSSSSLLTSTRLFPASRSLVSIVRVTVVDSSGASSTRSRSTPKFTRMSWLSSLSPVLVIRAVIVSVRPATISSG
jgi:hypothetical protein